MMIIQNWGLVFQKQVLKAGTCNYIPRYIWDVITGPCPAPGTQVLNLNLKKYNSLVIPINAKHLKS